MSDIRQLVDMDYSGAYFCWLCGKIDFGNKVHEYWQLLGILFYTKYIPILEMDQNRESDGLDYRWIFCSEYDVNLEELNSQLGANCRVLEMMIAMAELISNDELGDRTKGDRTPDWFWRMVKNLGLNPFRDVDGSIDLETRSCITYILHKWIYREFDYNGVGSPFPLKNPPGDERDVELLYQMRAYVQENFPD